MIKVMNLRTTKPTELWDVVVDRTSMLGNPFPMDCGKGEDMRNLVCEEYKYWLDKQITEHNPAILARLEILLKIYNTHHRLRLFCWCAPKRCHADYLRTILTQAIVKGTSWQKMK